MYANLRARLHRGGVLRREEHELAARVLERVVDQQLHNYLAVHVVLKFEKKKLKQRAGKNSSWKPGQT